MRLLKASAMWLTVLASVMVVGCSIETTEPTEVEIQVIEELDFAPSLGIDLAAMQLTGTGVYIQDVTVGEGEPVTSGDQIWIAYQGWLYTGTRFDAGEFNFRLGEGLVIQGFDQGIEGMRLGGKRRMVIPPELAYGTQGVGSIPPGSVLVFEVDLLNVAPGG